LDQLRADTAEDQPAPYQAERKPDLTTSAEPDEKAKPDLRVVRDTDLARPRGTAEPDLPPAVYASTPEPAQTTETSARSVPVLGAIAAGELTLADNENIREYLALPAQYVRGEEVYLLEVRGDSMTGEDGVLEGDYVIVDHQASWNNGDMVVVFVEGDGATLKRIWRDGASIHLQPSNPARKPITLGPGEDPHIQGKVIGVARWHIGTARRRPQPLQ